MPTKNTEPMHPVRELVIRNRIWRSQRYQQDPTFFTQHAQGQQPKTLFIACSDSRVDPAKITNSDVGELFVQRNVANLVVPDDDSMQAAVTYAVNALKVKHIVICGHYGCGGVKAAMDIAEGRSEIDEANAPLTPWLKYIISVYEAHQDALGAIADYEMRFRQLVRLNVETQRKQMADLTSVRRAWQKGEEPQIHGAVYDLPTGKLHMLGLSEEAMRALEADCHGAVIQTQIERLFNQAQSYNPFKWLGAKAKAEAITDALNNIALHEGSISNALNNTNSALYQALNQKRLLPFSFLGINHTSWFSAKARALEVALVHCEQEQTCQL